MSTHDWHTLAAFGLLTAALSIFDRRIALYTIGVASAVIVVRHSSTFTGFLEGGNAA
jgi:hypothetical protein